MEETTSPLAYFQDLLALKIMIILYRDNPDVSLAELQKELEIEPTRLSQLLASLIRAELVHVRTEGNSQLFTLSREARMSLNRLGLNKLLEVQA